METSVQSCGSQQPMSTPVSVEPVSSDVGSLTTTPHTVPEPQPTVDVAPLGDSPTVVPSVKLECADHSTPAMRSVDSAGDPAAPVEAPPNLTPTLVEAPPLPSASEPTKTSPVCTTKNDVRPVPEVVPKVQPAPDPEAPASVPSTPTCGRKVPLTTAKQDVQPLEKAADAPVAGSTPTPLPTSSLPVPAKRPVKLVSGPATYHQPSPSTMSSVTPTPSTSTVQSNLTTPRSFCPDQLAADDPATSSSYGSMKTPASSAAGSYMRSHQRRVQHRDSGANTPSTVGVATANPAYHHDRKSRSVSPTSQSDSFRSSTSSTLHTSTVQDSRGRSPAQTAMSPQPPSPVDWASSMSPYRMRAFSPRHATEYRHCVASEPDDVRPSRRHRENTHVKLFGADKPDSPRTAAAASAASAGGLKPTAPRRHTEDTQATLFGPPDPHRRSSRPHPDTHHSLFGPPPPPHTQRRSRSCFQDTADLLYHDASAGGRSDESLQAVRERYALRHQDTGTKLFGDAVPTPCPPIQTPKPYRDHDIFLVGHDSPSTSSSITSTLPQADPLPSP